MIVEQVSINDKVDDNELSGLEADQPVETGKVIARGDTVIKIGRNEYTVLLPLVNDYGTATILPVQYTQPLLLHYESSKSKAKRIKNEAKALLYCTERRLEHMYRVLTAGYYETLQIYYLITKCYGLSLSDLLATQPAEKFTKPTCLKVGIVTMKCIQQLHETGFVHRDIKPNVFVIGQAAPDQIYIVHLGLARRFRNRDNTHVRCRSEIPLIGNVRYISRNAHKRRDRSQRDDLESWWFMFIEMFSKELLTWNQKTDLEQVRVDKEQFMSETGFRTIVETCKDISSTFYEIVRHINGLKFTTEPNYHRIKKVLKKEITLNNCKFEPYDWVKAIQKPGRKPSLCTSEMSSSSEDIKSGERSGKSVPPEELPE